MKNLMLIHFLYLLMFSVNVIAKENLLDCIAKTISNENIKAAIVTGLNRSDSNSNNKKIQRRFLPRTIDNITYTKYVLFNDKDIHNTPHILVYPALFRFPSPRYGESNWVSSGEDGCLALGCRWLIFFRLSNIPPRENLIPAWGIDREPKEIPLTPPYDDTIPFLIELADLECGMFQIKDDPLDNRLGVDLEVLYEDLQLIISHRPDWPSVPAEQLQTDFAKAVLARLLGKTDQPDHSNSEYSEVGGQGAD